MSNCFTAHFVGFPLSQINLDLYDSRHILKDLQTIIKETLNNKENNQLANKIYTLNPQTYIKEDGSSLDPETIIFIQWIQTHEKQLKDMRFDLEAYPNEHGEAPYIFGHYLSLSLPSQVKEATRFDFTRFIRAQQTLTQFADLLESLDPIVLQHFKKNHFITIWSNVQSYK